MGEGRECRTNKKERREGRYDGKAGRSEELVTS